MGPARTRGHTRRRAWGRVGRVCRMGGRGARRAVHHRGSRTGACRGRGGEGGGGAVAGWVSGAPGARGARTIQVQDETGGVTVYLGRDDWPPLAVGQPLGLVLGYLRVREGNLELYVRNAWHVRPGPV